MIPAWLHTVSCTTPGCTATLQVWFDNNMEDRNPLVARAASGLGWLWVDNHARCPAHADALREAMLDGRAGDLAAGIRWGIAERLHLRRIEVTP